ncbi:hypothetical protein BSP38_215 [Bacillus phage BSP38]|uniref:Uncharacterized protein n=1 Tax=Bacillus phage BSP38 TaxID=2283013 RepID=A0A345MK75_BPBSP|nr:hypothetical protein HWB82_gp103 [Bacillus phage BSP38]AXH71257.1 hypothetical protein BSP38_215 [Bacillus phage BSP38]
MKYGLIVEGVVVSTYDNPKEAMEAAQFALEESGVFHQVKPVYEFSSSDRIFKKELLEDIERWKQQVERQDSCQSDHERCPLCNEQLFFCECAKEMAVNIMRKQFGYPIY